MWESTGTSLCKVAALSDPSAYRPQLIEVSLDRVAQYGVALCLKRVQCSLHKTSTSRERRESVPA